MKSKKSYDIGKAAYNAGKAREPMKDQVFVNSIQTKDSEKHSPKSPAATMTETQRNMMQGKLTSWKQGWDDARKEDSE